ncbi:MAG: DUF5069 domain-containing protein [Chthoniobacteraceae bacterium]
MKTPDGYELPCSAYDKAGGIVYFPRMIAKICLHASGVLSPDYHKNLGVGFDGRCCRFLGVGYADVRKRVINGLVLDEDILDWCFFSGTKPTGEQILVWNKFMTKRGWRDEDDGSTQELEAYKAASGLAHRTDILTFFDYYEVDEGRKP